MKLALNHLMKPVIVLTSLLLAIREGIRLIAAE